MTISAVITETEILDGWREKKVVRPGDKVSILPVDMREHDEQTGDAAAWQVWKALYDRLGGEGPFTVSRIEVVEGETVFYLDGAKIQGTSILACDCVKGMYDTALRRWYHAYVHGKRIVHPLDTVVILPVELRKQKDGDSAQKQYDELVKDFGLEPLTIIHIGVWRCGRAMLLLKKLGGSRDYRWVGDFM